MQIKKEVFAAKPIKEYDTNGNGTIDGEEINIFKSDCKSLYAEAYGENSKQFQDCSELLDKTEIKFVPEITCFIENKDQDYENQKYTLNLDSTPQDENLKDSKLNITDFAGMLLHEMEHLKQSQNIYNYIKKTVKGRSKLAKYLMGSNTYSNKYETYAEMERMYFYKKIGTYSNKNTNPIYINFIEQSEKINADPLAEREKFIKNFDEESFYSIIKKETPYYDRNCYEDTKDGYHLKDLLF